MGLPLLHLELYALHMETLDSSVTQLSNILLCCPLLAEPDIEYRGGGVFHVTLLSTGDSTAVLKERALPLYSLACLIF